MTFTPDFDERAQAAVAAFQKQFGKDPEYVVRAPGRVNLIGEHTDYNDGYVLPVAIDRQFVIAASPKADRKDLNVHVYSVENDATDIFSLAKIEKSKAEPWSDYLRGMMMIWQACAFKVRAFEAAISGDVPQGAGLSSSAAYEVAVGTLVNEMMATGISPKQLATLAQKAENRFIGVQCGIMDQFISAMGRADAALLLDCRTLASRPVPLRLAERGLAIVIIHSGVQRGLVDSQYNDRRLECTAAVTYLAKKLKRDDIKALRDVTLAELKKAEKGMPELPLKRARHVISENERVLEAVEALGKGDLKALGKLMYASHDSMRDDFEITVPAIDRFVELAKGYKGTIGCRMTGGGFGGCLVALMPEAEVAGFEAAVVPTYKAETGLTPTVWVCKAAGGASVLDSPMKRAGL